MDANVEPISSSNKSSSHQHTSPPQQTGPLSGDYLIMNTSGPLLRASCDRCRAQKLRCLPSSETDAAAPCQRCLRGKGIKSCVFSRRSRTGRNKRSSTGGELESKWPAVSKERCKEKEGMELPGMATFSLSNFSNCESPEASPTAAIGEGLNGIGIGSPWSQDDEKTDLSLWGMGQENLNLNLNLNLDSILLSPASASFPTSNTTDELSQTPTKDFATSVSEGDLSCFDISAFLSSNQDFLLGDASNSTTFDTLDLDLDTNFWTSTTNAITEEKLPGPGPGPAPNTLVSLTTLLSSLSQYESKLTSHHSVDPDNYPIGDALFLSQRFCVILSSAEGMTQDMPAMLLTLSCYITLTRIYSSVFSYLHEHLNVLPNSYSMDGKNRSEDMKVYQGLRLGQLQPVDMSAGRELATRAKKAVFMLLSSLGDAEGMLSLPGDVRVIANSRAETHGQDGTDVMKGGGERTVLFDVGTIVGLTNGRLYKAMKEQARLLRRKVEDIEDLLKKLLDF